MGKLEARVVVGRRRELKAIDLATAGTAGGTAAIIAILFLPASIFPATYLALFLPAWVLVLMTSFSYKHFRLQVENQRDFVAIGAAAGAFVGTFRSFVTGDLLHPASQFLILLLLAAALSRRGRLDDLRTLDFRSPKILRPVLGLSCSLLCAGGLVLGLWGMGAEIEKSALAAQPPAGEGTVEAPRTGGPSRPQLRARVRSTRRLARQYSRDAHLWSRLGTTRLELLRAELWEGDESGWEAGLAEAAEAFRRSRSHSRSHRLLGLEGWAWLSTAMVSHSPSPELLEKALKAFEEAARAHPRFATHAAGMGETLYRLGKPIEGEAALSKALELDESESRMDRLPPELGKVIRAKLGGGKR
ncbi:MAG: tetratricopeptide repeat protein [Planctomycetota bacterium]